MNFNIAGCGIIISPLFTAAVTALLLCDKTGIMPVIMLAVLLHECGHIFFMSLIGNPPKKVEFLPFAIEITPGAAYKSIKNQVFVSSAGIITNIICTVICYIIYNITGSLWTAAFSSANFAVFIFNLLPVNNLDGGELLNIFNVNFLGEARAKKINIVFSVIFLIVLVITGGYFFIINKNPTLLIFCLYIGILQPLLSFSAEQKKIYIK